MRQWFCHQRASWECLRNKMTPIIHSYGSTIMRFVFVENFFGKTSTRLELLTDAGYFLFSQEGEEVVYLYSRKGRLSSTDGDFIHFLATQPGVDIHEYQMDGYLVPFRCSMHREDGSLIMDDRPQQFVSESGLRPYFGLDVDLDREESIRIVQAVEAERIRLLKEMDCWPVAE